MVPKIQTFIHKSNLEKNPIYWQLILWFFNAQKISSSEHMNIGIDYWKKYEFPLSVSQCKNLEGAFAAACKKLQWILNSILHFLYPITFWAELWLRTFTLILCCTAPASCIFEVHNLLWLPFFSKNENDLEIGFGISYYKPEVQEQPHLANYETRDLWYPCN